MTSRIEADIRGWDAISDHRTGTAGDRATAKWLADRLRDAGAEPRLDEFPFERRVLRNCAIGVGKRRAEGVPLFDGGLTEAQGMQGKLGLLAAAEGDIAVASFASPSYGERNRRRITTCQRRLLYAYGTMLAVQAQQP